MRRPYPAGPNSASGSVPRAIVSMPLPPPCSSTNGIAATGPKIASSTRTDRMQHVASRAEIIGDIRRSRVNSIRRAADLRRSDQRGGENGDRRR